jgi:acetyltransferase
LNHTGVLAGSDEGFNALCRKVGVVRLRTLDDLLEAAEAFSMGRLPAGDGVGVVLSSGALKGLVLDLAEDLGMRLPEPSAATRERLERFLPAGMPAGNPLDMGAAGFGDEENYAACGETLLEDPGIDLLMIHGELPREENPRRSNPDRYRRFVQAQKPVFFFSRSSHGVSSYGRDFRDAAKLPFLQDALKSLSAVRALTSYAKTRRRRLESPGEAAAAPAGFLPTRQMLKAGREMLDIVSGESLLNQLEIPTAGEKLAHSAEEAVSLASELGFPVALKIHSPEVTHKSDGGGVVLGIRDAREIVESYRKLEPPIHTERHGVLVQRMIDGGLETILAYRDDPLYGPLLMFGLGGIHVEVFKDVSFRLPPLTEDEALSMIEELRGKRLFESWRGKARRDLSTLTRLLVRFSAAACAFPSYLCSLEINPLMILEEGRGVVAVDLVGVPKTNPGKT